MVPLTDVIGVGIVGLGATRGWAATAHLPALRSLPAFDVRALSGRTPRSAAAAAEAHGVPVACADHVALARRDDVDLVVVTVKVPEHRHLVMAALDAGKAVLCEWPLGNGLAEAEELTRHAADRELSAYVGLQARSAPAIRFLRELVGEDAVGEVLSTTIVGTGDRWGPTVDPATSYLADRSNGATLLTIPFGHTVDAVCHVLGEVTDLQATTGVRRPVVQCRETGTAVAQSAEDQVAVIGRLAGGAIASLHYRGGRSAGTNFLWEINGTAGDLVVRGRTGHLQYGMVEILVSDRPGGTLELLDVPERFRNVRAKLPPLGVAVAEAYVQISRGLRGEDGEDGEVATFADGARRHRMLAAVECSARTGVRQFLEE